MKKLITILIVVILVGVAVIPRVLEIKDEASDAGEEIDQITVETQEASYSDLYSYVDLTGNVQADAIVPVLVSVSAKVTQVNVKVGDYVDEDAVLFTMDTEDIQDQVTQASISVNQAQAALSQASVGVESAESSQKTAQLAYDMALSNYNMSKDSYEFAADNLEKYEELYSEGIISENEYEQMKLNASPETLTVLDKQLAQAEESLNQAELGVKQAQAAYSQAQASLNLTQQNQTQANNTLEDMEVKAPVAGFVTTLNVTENAMASAAQASLVINKIDLVKISVEVTGDMVNNLSAGDQVDVDITSLGQTFQGTIETVGTSANATTLMYPVVIDVENPDYTIKPGMFASVTVVKEERKNALVVPSEAVLIRDGQTVVYRQVDDTTAEEVNVTTDLDNGEYVEIVDGLSEGDFVITTGAGLINETSQLNILRGED